MPEKNYNIRSLLIKLVTFLGGIYFVLEFLLPKIALEKIGIADFHDSITNWFITVSSMALGLGIINLLTVHGSRIIYMRHDWVYSVVLLLGMFSMGFISILEAKSSTSGSAEQERTSLLADFGLDIVAQYRGENNVGVLPAIERKNILLKEVDAYLLETSVKLTAIKQRVLIEKKSEIAANSEEFPVKELSHWPAYIKEVEQGVARLKAAVAEVGEQSTLEKQSIPEKLILLSDAIRASGVFKSQLLREVVKAGVISKLNILLIEGVFSALGAAMFSLLSVYIAAAAFRAFRICTFESSLMMGAAVIVILGQTSFGLWVWEGMPALRQWLMEVPNAAAFRAIKIGSSVAALVLAFRMWLSIESESFVEK
jgi:hypothetical protein